MGGTKRTSCAYCDRRAPLTREHIIPKFLYRWFPEQKLGYNKKADAFVVSEAQVRDVCGECNNGPLGSLDAYAKSFFEDVDCARTYSRSQSLTVPYEYESLLQWLLKVSYNAVRAHGEPPPLLVEAAPYLVGRGEAPSVAFCFLEVVRDAPIRKDEVSLLPPEAARWTHLPAKMFRVGPVFLNDRGLPIATEHCMRFVAVNSWYFTFCLVPSTTTRPARRSLTRTYSRFVPDAVRLNPTRASIDLQVSRRTCLDIYAPQGMLVAPQWQRYIGKQERHS